MKKIRYFALALALVLSGAAVAGAGYYIRYELQAPLGIHQDADLISVPFLYAQSVREQAPAFAEPTQPPTETTAPPTTEPPPPETPPATQPPSEPPPPPTVPETQPPTEVTEPPPEPPVYGVDESHFDDVLFIGDSRTVGLREYARLGSADYFCQVGMTVFSMFSESAADVDFDTQSLESLLSSRKYSRIYIALGINEAGYALDSIRAKYSECITRIKGLQPDAIIVLQSVMTVGRNKAASASYFQVEHLQSVSQIISGCADNKTVFYIDPNQVFADEEGYLPSEYSKDGCHLYGKYYELWARFICDNAILI